MKALPRPLEASSALYAGLRRFAIASLTVPLLGFTASAIAQITSPNGTQPTDNRTSSMGSSPDPAVSAVQESHAPQSSDARSKARGSVAGKQNKPEGATGFDNGLYGTGTGSNK